MSYLTHASCGAHYSLRSILRLQPPQEGYHVLPKIHQQLSRQTRQAKFINLHFSNANNRRATCLGEILGWPSPK